MCHRTSLILVWRKYFPWKKLSAPVCGQIALSLLRIYRLKILLSTFLRIICYLFTKYLSTYISKWFNIHTSPQKDILLEMRNDEGEVFIQLSALTSPATSMTIGDL